MSDVNFLEATMPGKKPASIQVKANKRNGRVLVPGTNGKGHILQTYKTFLEGCANKSYQKLPNASTPATGTYGTKRGGKRRKTTRRHRTRKH